MRCPYCAEEIQDAARLCRFCGATRDGELWQPPSRGGPRRRREPGELTYVIAGWLLAISALVEVISMTSAVPLFGRVLSGVAVVPYHLLFGALYAAMAFGILRRTAWGYRAVMIGTAIYSLERLLFIFDREGQRAYLLHQVGDFSAVAFIADDPMLQSGIVMTSVVMMLCWWGFAGWVHWRRAWFGSGEQQRDPGHAHERAGDGA